jgi:hypothetical protein
MGGGIDVGGGVGGPMMSAGMPSRVPVDNAPRETATAKVSSDRFEEECSSFPLQLLA